MGKWKMVRLGDYITQVRGVSYKPEDALENEDETHKPILRAHNIQSNGLNDNNLIYVNEKKIKNSQYIRKGDIIICTSSGSKDLVGKAAQASNDMFASVGAFCKVIRAKNTINYVYLKHYFSSPVYRNVISELSSGANINNIRNEHIDDLQIPLPPLDIQQKIADVLDKASALIELRKAQLDKLDLLIKSQFIEMFGDPVANSYNWDTTSLGNVCEKITDGEHNNPEFIGSGIPMIMANNIRDSVILEGCKFISEKDYRRFSMKCNPEKGDVLLVSRGATIGRCCENNLNEPFSLMGSVILLKDKADIVLSKFLLNWFKNSSINKIIYNTSSASAQQAIYIKDLSKKIIILPPLKLQNEFAAFVEEVETQKKLLQNSLEKMELHYKSLMQKCFRGEIF